MVLILQQDVIRKCIWFIYIFIGFVSDLEPAKDRIENEFMKYGGEILVVYIYEKMKVCRKNGTMDK